jgi:transposase
MAEAPVVGIDVGKDTLVLAWSGSRTRETVANDPPGRRRLLGQLPHLQPRLLVLEASGGYEQPLLSELWAAKLPVARVNPRRVREFARATGQVAKTDALDAGILVRFGELMAPPPQPPPSPARQQLAVLQARRQDLVKLRVAEDTRAQQARAAPVRASIARILAVLDDEITTVEAAMDEIIAADAELSAQAALLQTMPGIGPVSARLVLATLPELGQATPKQIAALAGVAPFNHDSGRIQGQRAIAAGRKAVRTGLYMAVVAATVHNPVLGAFYHRLLEAGKPGPVALIATMRKMLVILNGMLRDGTPWQLEEAVMR